MSEEVRSLIGLSVRGRFWLAEDPGRSAIGKLRIEEEGGAVLELDGSIRKGIRVRVHPVRRGHDVQLGADYHIHGEVDGTPVTLGWCASLSFPRSEPDRYRVGYVLLGGHFGKDLLAQFDTAFLRMRGTELWFASEGGALPAGTESCLGPDWRLGLLTEGSPRLRIDFNSPRPAHEIVEVFRSVSYFVTICLRLEASVVGIALSNSHEDHPDGELYVPFMTSDTSGSLDGVEPEEFWAYRREMWLSYEDIGGIAGLAKWVEVSDRFWPAVSLLTGVVQMAADSAEGRFIKYCIAAEAFARILKGDDDVNLAKDLESIAKDVAGDAFASFSGARNWPGVIAETRSQLVVHRGLRGNYDPVKLHWLAELLRLLVTLGLLRQCGVATDKLDPLLQGGWLDGVAEQVRAAVNTGARE